VRESIEFIAAGAVIILALSVPSLRGARRRSTGVATGRGQSVWKRHSARRSAILRRHGVLLVFLIVFALGAVGAWRGTHPDPAVHDEFSYLLAADTYGHGRLANPTHPFWEHFESFYIIWQPTYVSKYPPGPGLFMALGTFVFGHPIFAVWLSVAAAAAAIFWMLRTWFTPGWALAGTLIPTARMLLLWADNYWAAALAVMGGALVFGALARFIERPRAGSGVLLAIGVSVLANTRPFEGLLVCVPAAVVLLVWAARRIATGDYRTVVSSLGPAFLLVTATLAWMSYYNYRTTGDPLTMPYTVYTDSYAIAGEFAPLPRKDEPVYRHDELREFHYDYHLPGWEAARSNLGFNAETWRKSRKTFKLLIGFAMVIPLLVGLVHRFRSDAWTRLATITCLIVILGSFAVVHHFPRYLAPVLAIAMLPVVHGLRYIRVWSWRGRPAGRRIATGLVLVYAVILLPWMATRLSASAYPRGDRSLISERLEEMGGTHLVVVRYAPGHSLHDEWVYNAADLDGSPIIWAREMDTARNERLFDYFGDRQVWLAEPDSSPASLRPYPR